MTKDDLIVAVFHFMKNHLNMEENPPVLLDRTGSEVLGAFIIL